MPVLDSFAQALFLGYPILDVPNREVVTALHRLRDARNRMQVRAALHDLTGSLADLYEIKIDLMTVYDFPGQEGYKAGYTQLKRFLEMEVLAFDLGASADIAELIGHVTSWLKADAKTVDRPLVGWLQSVVPAVTVGAPGATGR